MCRDSKFKSPELISAVISHVYFCMKRLLSKKRGEMQPRVDAEAARSHTGSENSSNRKRL